ncbi:ParB/RepB/Spo0J family partition protein [Streptomyces rhizosphaericus]|uniref:ParB/RepB/Spo0J family partition protein n=1 Tax=Streptomyces rhizosphaericus TaxID=114699 RepID=UPI000A36441E|nr:ParB N-terminal domain-containing protein [Streptomyces rhizosphaericus]
MTAVTTGTDQTAVTWGRNVAGVNTGTDEVGERQRHSLSTVSFVSTDALMPASSPRLEGISSAHVQALADSDATLPPIIVHRGTMRVIDGMHRLRAAVLRGQEHMAVQYFDGSADDAFVLAVESNVSHGLPLSSADRAQAAERILRSHPQWSDRTVAAIAGLAAKTVRTMRQRLEGVEPVHSRTGRDGRVRPLSTSDARRKASAYIAEHPSASLREVAEVVGISPSTVRDVRNRVRHGEDPVPRNQRRTRQAELPSGVREFDKPAQPGDWPAKVVRHQAPEMLTMPGDKRQRSTALKHAPKGCSELLHKLSRDPSLRFTENGRYLLQMMSAQQVLAARYQQLAGSIPSHAVGIAAAVARECAQAWIAFAHNLEAGHTE